MIASMTGFGRADGETPDGEIAWAWELRGVNGRGLEVRLRLPPGLEALEAGLREEAGRVLRRGSITGTLTLRREEQRQLVADPAAIKQVLALALDLARQIPGSPPPRAEALLALPGVLRQVQAGTDEALPIAALRAGFSTALAGLAAGRREEGARLAVVLGRLLAEIAALCERAVAQARDQPAEQRARMMEAVTALLAASPALPEERIAQEVAVLAARSDVREELDRLASHLAAARALLVEAEPVGRRFEFLLQEFNREANTLCSKSASLALTETGLALKAAIERLREQVANIE